MLAAYYAVLLLFLVSSFFPQYRIWGVNWWAHFPGYVPFVFLAVGAVAPIVMGIARRHWSDSGDKGATADRSREYYIIIIACLIMLFGLAFYLLRARTHFLGDGYQISSILASENPFVKPTETGEALVHLWVYRLLGSEGDTSALLSYQIVSISAGILFLTAVAVFSRILFGRTRESILFFLGLVTAGYMLLFFGYVENYSLFASSVAAYSLMGLLVIKGRVNRLVIVPILAVSIFFHIIGVSLIPSAVYLLGVNSKFSGWLSRLRRGTKLLAVIIAGLLVLVVFSHFYSNDYFLRFALVPLFEDRFTVEGYTLFSFKHIVDFLNLLLLLLPGLPILATSLFFLPRREIFKQRESRYFLILVLSTLGAAFIFDPKLGMPRDWDLFSFSGVPLAAFSYFLILDKRKFIRSYVTVSVLSVVLGVLILFPRAASQVVPSNSLEHFKDYIQLDNEKSRTAYTILFDYYKSLGDLETAVKVRQERDKMFPEVLLIKDAVAQTNEGNTLAALNLQRRALSLNPVYPDAYAHLGATFANLGQNDSALHYLEIARGLTPYDTSVLFNLGVTSIRMGRYEAGRQALSKAARAHPGFYPAYGQLLALAVNLGDIEESVGYFQRLMSNPDVPFEYFRGIGDLYLSRQQYEYAAAAYRVALERGLDSMYVKQVAEKYPQLKE